MDEFLRGFFMYTPEEIRISHPSYFNLCLNSDNTSKKKVPCRQKEIIHDPFESSILSYIQNILPIAGTLKEDSRGFIYLKVANEYITSIIPFFNDPSIDLPPYFSNEFKDGAHIPICSMQ